MEKRDGWTPEHLTMETRWMGAAARVKGGEDITSVMARSTWCMWMAHIGDGDGMVCSLRCRKVP